MKYAIAVILLALSSQAIADKYVRGYTKRDGTYVEGHYKTDPNSTKFDNYSTKGNTNPYTGKDGTVDPYKSDFNGYQSPPTNQYQYEYGK